MIETPIGILLLMFQENRFFWAVKDTDRDMVECNFCGARHSDPRHLDHHPYCVIDMAMAAIRADQTLLDRVRNAPPRVVWKGSIQLTVFKGGDPKRAIEYPGTN